MTFTFYHDDYAGPTLGQEEIHKNIAKDLLDDSGIEDESALIFKTPEERKQELYSLTGADQEQVDISTFENNQFIVEFDIALTIDQINILRTTPNIIAYKYRAQ